MITRPEESYRLCCVVVCDLETSRMGAPYIYDISLLRVNVLTQFLKQAVFYIAAWGLYFVCGFITELSMEHIRLYFRVTE